MKDRVIRYLGDFVKGESEDLSREIQGELKWDAPTVFIIEILNSNFIRFQNIHHRLRTSFHEIEENIFFISQRFQKFRKQNLFINPRNIHFYRLKAVLEYLFGETLQ